MFIHPLELPGVPLSWVEIQLPSVCRELLLAAFAGITEDALVTLIETSVTQTPPAFPHAFTCNVCPPVDAEIEVSMVWLLKTVVLVLLSRLYPVVTTLCDPHQFENAESLNGELTLALFPGL